MRVLTVLLLASVSFAPVSLMAQVQGDASDSTWKFTAPVNLLSTRTDPRTGKQTFTATKVTLGDPDPALFDLPAAFKVTDIRQTAAPEPN